MRRCRRCRGLHPRSATRSSWCGQNPDASRLHVFLALLLAEQGETERAIRTLEPFLEEDPRDADLANALVRILVEADRPGEARDVTSRVARELEPVDPDTAAELIRELMRTLARADRWDLVPELADEVPVRASSDVRAEILELVVEALRRRGRFEEALARIDASGLDGAALQATRAELLLRGDRPDRAAPILAELRAEDPQLAAQVYHALGRYEEALPLWERTVAADPVGPQARFALGAAYERTGRAGQAVDVFRDLITDFPDFHLALNYLGYMWAEQGANLEEAQSLVERAVSLDPGNGAYADSLGWVYYQRGEYEKALEHLRRAADVLPSDGTVQEHLGDVHLALGDPAAARDAYESALALGDVDREGELERKLKAVERLLRGQEP
jgi:tetratricopeptide (TPR) repeat protein